MSSPSTRLSATDRPVAPEPAGGSSQPTAPVTTLPTSHTHHYPWMEQNEADALSSLPPLVSRAMAEYQPKAPKQDVLTPPTDSGVEEAEPIVLDDIIVDQPLPTAPDTTPTPAKPAAVPAAAHESPFAISPDQSPAPATSPPVEDSTEMTFLSPFEVADQQDQPPIIDPSQQQAPLEPTQPESLIPADYQPDLFANAPTAPAEHPPASVHHAEGEFSSDTPFQTIISFPESRAARESLTQAPAPADPAQEPIFQEPVYHEPVFQQAYPAAADPYAQPLPQAQPIDPEYPEIPRPAAPPIAPGYSPFVHPPNDLFGHPEAMHPAPQPFAAEPAPAPAAAVFTPFSPAPAPQSDVAQPSPEGISPDSELASALQPIIESSLQRALYAPDTGIHIYLEPMLRNTVRRAIAEQIESSSQFRQVSGSDRLAWRMQALLSSKSYDEILFEKTKRYQVEEVYMLRRTDFSLLSYASTDPVRHSSERRVMGTIENLRMEICDEENMSVASDFILPGERNGVVREGATTFMIAIMRGEPNSLVRSDLDFIQHQVEERFGERLLRDDVHFLPLLQPVLENALLITAPAPPR